MLKNLENIINLLNSQGSSDGYSTPQSLMDSLKQPAKAMDTPELTNLGAYFKAALKDSPELLDIVRWILFHLDYPGKPFGNDELATRNWISIKTKHQEEVDWIHEKVIGLSSEELQKIYSPSHISKKFEEKDLEEFIEDKWFYRFPIFPDTKNNLHACPIKKAPGIGAEGQKFLCFVPDFKNGEVWLFECRTCDKRKKRSLANMLHEPPQETLLKIFNFYDTIFNFSEEEYNFIETKYNFIRKKQYKNFTYRCNYYLRVPIIWKGPKRYLSKFYIAFMDDIQHPKKIADSLRSLDITTKICLFIINSHMAYVIGDKQGQKRGHHSFFHTISHKLSNLEASIYRTEYNSAKKQLKQLINELDVFYKIENGKKIKSDTIGISNLSSYHNEQVKHLLSLHNKNHDINLDVPHDKQKKIQIKFYPEFFQVILFEIFHNLDQYAPDNTTIQFKYIVKKDKEDKEWLVLEVINTTVRDSYLNIKSERIYDKRGKRRMRGLGVIELIQDYLNAPWWYCRPLGHSKVEFSYFIAPILRKGV